jgi:hypothetical protein
MLTDLLGSILEFFWDCVPRPVTIASNERASRFLFGRDFEGTRLEGFVRQSFGPGFYITLPLLEDWGQRVVAAQHQITDLISCQDQSGYTWIIQLDVEFEIVDLPVFDLCQHSGDEFIAIISTAAAVTTAAGWTKAKMMKSGPHSFAQHVTTAIEERLAHRGVEISATRVLKWQQTRSIHLSGV